MLLFIDARYKNLESIRNVLALPIQPLQRLTTNLTTQPGILWDEFSGYLDTQEIWRAKICNFASSRQSMPSSCCNEVMQTENAQLRKLFDLSQRADFPIQMAEIIYVERDIF
jgi:cell shape-determining protein MreC